MGDGYTFPWPKKKTPGLHGGAMERSEGGTVASTSSEVIPEQGSALERRDGCASQSEGRKREREETFYFLSLSLLAAPFLSSSRGCGERERGKKGKKVVPSSSPPALPSSVSSAASAGERCSGGGLVFRFGVWECEGVSSVSGLRGGEKT